MYSWFSRLHLVAGQIRCAVYIEYRLADETADIDKLLVQFYSTTIAVSIVSSTLNNVGFAENKMSLRTWAMRPCCASTAIFVLKVSQLHR